MRPSNMLIAARGAAPQRFDTVRRQTSPRRIARAIQQRLPAGLVAFVLYAGLAVAATAPVWSTATTSVIGRGGDPPEYIWQLAWPPFAMTHGMNPFYASALNAPWGANLMWTAPSLPGLVLWPLTAWLGPVVAYNALVVAAFAASGWCMYLAAAAITRSRLAGFVAGLFYAFSPFMLAHTAGGHVVLTLALVPPLLLLFGYDALVRRRWPAWRAGAAGGVVMALQFMTFPEGVAVAAIGGVIALVWLVAFNWRAIDRGRVHHASTALLSSLTAFTLLAAPAAAVMFLGPQRLHGGTVQTPDLFVADLLGFFVPGPSQAIAPTATIVQGFTGNFTEWTAYLGLPLLVILASWFAIARRRASMWVVAASLLTAALLSMGPEAHIGGVRTGFALPAMLFAQLPLLGNLIPSRLAVLMFLFAALALAQLVAYVQAIPRAWPRALLSRVTLTAGVALVFVSQFPAVPLPTEELSVPAFFTDGAVDRIPEGATVLVLPYIRSGAQIQTEVWQAAAHFRFRMPEGYVFSPAHDGPITGPTPTILGSALVALQEGCTTNDINHVMGVAIWGPVQRWVDHGCPTTQLDPVTLASYRGQLRAWGVTSVIAGPSSNHAQVLAFLETILGSSPDALGGVDVWWTA